MSGKAEASALLAAEQVEGPTCAAEGHVDPPVRTKVTDAGLDLGDSPGIYDSVLVATFGGVTLELAKRTRQVHPIWMLLLALPLFVVQVSTILILRSGLDIDRPVYTRGDSQSAALLTLKLALVGVLYLTNFKPMIHFGERLVFLSNPLTWVEVAHYDPSRSAFLRWMHHTVGLATIIPCAFCSILMDFAVSYMVCIDSVSIIFSAESAQDAIFNSLAIGFVIDLGDSWWAFVQHNFHLTRIDEFKFELRNDTWTEKGELKHVSDTLVPPVYRLLLRATTWSRFGMKSSFLRVGFGARRTQAILSLLLLCVIYTRQLFVVLYAIRTNILPAARDLCEEFELMNGKHGLAAKVWDMVQSHMLVSMDVEVNYTVDKTLLEVKCVKKGPLQRMELSDMWVTWQHDWFKIVVCLSSMLALVVAPSVAIALHGLLQPDDLDKIDEKQQEDLETLKTEMKDVQTDLKQLQALTAQLAALREAAGQAAGEAEGEAECEPAGAPAGEPTTKE